jgi:hypothetical protein
MGNAVDIFFARGTPSPFDVFEDERRLADRVLYCGHFRRTRPVVVELDQLASAEERRCEQSRVLALPGPLGSCFWKGTSLAWRTRPI